MPASKSKRAAKGKPAKRAKAAKSAKRPARKSPPKAAAKGKPASRPAARAASATGHAHCAATDPFGDPCQNVRRTPSKYCVIHSYLDR